MPDTPTLTQTQDAPPSATAREAATAVAERAVAERAVAEQAIIQALQGQIAAERATIEALTSRLVPGISDVSATAITEQIEAAQERLSSLQEQLARAQGGETQVFAGVPAPPPPPDVIPPEAVQMTEMFFVTVAVIAIGVPLARAVGRWLDRRGQRPAAPATSTLEPRLDRMEQAIEAIAIEVERVSEGQRFTNKLMGELRALPAPNPLEQWPANQAKGAAREALPAEQRVDR